MYGFFSAMFNKFEIIIITNGKKVRKVGNAGGLNLYVSVRNDEQSLTKNDF